MTREEFKECILMFGKNIAGSDWESAKCKVVVLIAEFDRLNAELATAKKVQVMLASWITAPSLTANDNIIAAAEKSVADGRE